MRVDRARTSDHDHTRSVFLGNLPLDAGEEEVTVQHDSLRVARVPRDARSCRTNSAPESVLMPYEGCRAERDHFFFSI